MLSDKRVRFKRIISAIDLYIESEPACVVVEVDPVIPGNTFKQKWLWTKQKLEDLYAVQATYHQALQKGSPVAYMLAQGD